jgi:hypothetical protein
MPMGISTASVLQDPLHHVMYQRGQRSLRIARQLDLPRRCAVGTQTTRQLLGDSGLRRR